MIVLVCRDCADAISDGEDIAGRNWISVGVTQMSLPAPELCGICDRSARTLFQASTK